MIEAIGVQQRILRVHQDNTFDSNGCHVTSIASWCWQYNLLRLMRRSYYFSLSQSVNPKFGSIIHFFSVIVADSIVGFDNFDIDIRSHLNSI